MDHFKQYAQKLHNNGYSVTPIRPRSKLPALNNWPNISYNKSGIDKASLEYANCGVGIVTGDVIAIDIDVSDPEICEYMIQFTLELLGPAPIRIGRAPRALLMYKTGSQVIRKQRTAKYKDAEGGKHQVEILGVGCQFVISGWHPGTKKDYYFRDRDDASGQESDTTWDTILSSPMAKLRPVSPGKLDKIKNEFERMRRSEWTKISKAKKSRPKEIYEDENDAAAMAMALPEPIDYEPDEIATVLESIDPNNLGYDEWLSALMGIHYQFYGSDKGRDLAVAWASDYSASDDSEDIISKYAGFECDPQSPTTFASVLAIRNEHETLGILREEYKSSDLRSIAPAPKEGEAKPAKKRQSNLVGRRLDKLDEYLARFVLIQQGSLVADLKDTKPLLPHKEFAMSTLDDVMEVDVAKPPISDPDKTEFKTVASLWISDKEAMKCCSMTNDLTQPWGKLEGVFNSAAGTYSAD